MWMRRVCWNPFNKSLVSVVHEYQLVQSQVCTEPDWCLLKICQGKLPWYNILINSCSNTDGEWFHVGCCDNHCQHHSSPMITSNWTIIKTYHRYSVRNCFHNRNNTLECHVYINNFMFSLTVVLECCSKEVFQHHNQNDKTYCCLCWESDFHKPNIFHPDFVQPIDCLNMK